MHGGARALACCMLLPLELAYRALRTLGAGALLELIARSDDARVVTRMCFADGVLGCALAPMAGPADASPPCLVIHAAGLVYELAKVPAALAELRRLRGARVLEDVAAHLAARWHHRRRPSSARSTSRGSRCTPSRSARSRTKAPQSNHHRASKRCMSGWLPASLKRAARSSVARRAGMARVVYCAYEIHSAGVLFVLDGRLPAHAR